MSVESGADRLVKTARFAQYHQSYRLDHLSADQWIHLYYMKRASGWDIGPRQWASDQIHEAVTVVRGPRTSAWIVLTAPSDDQPGPRVTGIIPIWDLALMRQVRASLDESVQVAMHWTMNPTSDADRRERNDEVERRANLREEYDRAMRELGVTS